MSESPPKRTEAHERLEVFLGEWHAVGVSYGGPNQSATDPKGSRSPWTSTHTARWHTGGFFLIQDERANSDGPFDTLSIMGLSSDSERYFARTFENHGFTREYAVTVEGRTWSFVGQTERAQIEISEDGRTQMIAWEWKPNDAWLPLCDRVARRVD